MQIIVDAKNAENFLTKNKATLTHPIFKGLQTVFLRILTGTISVESKGFTIEVSVIEYTTVSKKIDQLVYYEKESFIIF